jgi:hypothetical protein
MTTAQAYNISAATTQEKVLALLEWTEQEFCDFRYKNGIAYLHWYAPVNENHRFVMERSRMFWRWFRCVCNTIDFEFINNPDVLNLSVTLRRSLYTSFHCPRLVAKDIKPNQVVLAELNYKKCR